MANDTWETLDQEHDVIHKLLDNHPELTNEDVEQTFSKCCQVGELRIDYQAWRDGLLEIIKKRAL